MAQRVVTTYVDDLDGKEIADGEGGSVSFSLDGKTYEIDLSDKNAKKLRSALEPYLAVAKVVSGRSRRATSSSSRGSAKEIRDWGRANGHEIPDRGRIPNEVRAAWEAAH